MTIPAPETIQICQLCGAASPMSFKFCQRCGHVFGSPVSPPVPSPRPDADQGSRTVPPPPPAPPSPPVADEYDAASVRLGPYPAPREDGKTYVDSDDPYVDGPGGRWPVAPSALPPTPGAVPPPMPGSGLAPVTAAGLGRSDGQPMPVVGAPPPRPAPVPTVSPYRPSGQWSPGDLIAGRFLVHRKIVSGMGAVYLCYDQQACEPVAVKTYLEGIPSGSGGDSEFAQQFESEALLWIRLGRHPHVVQARYVLRLAGKPHIFLEYVPGPAGGESTVRRLLRAGRVDVATALLLAIQTCAGMEHATSVFPGFVHRDLKPENLLLTPDQVLKVTDFGLTRVFADFSGEVGVIAGTPPYMSPEQCLGLPALDTRSDVYALGVILYELLTGQRPFRAADVEGHLRAHLVDTPASPRHLVPDVPEAVERLVLRCLAKSPEARFPDFGALRAELTTCYEAVAGHPPVLPDPVEDDEGASAGLASVELARAISLVTLGRYDEAMTFFDLAVEHDPGLARAWYFRGLALNGLGRFDEALACLDRVVSLEPRDPNAWVEKGRALTRSGRRDEALTCFDRAIAVNPWHLAALYEKGVCLLFLGRFEEAAACIGEVAAIQPGPAVEAARQACLAGLGPSSGLGHGTGSSSMYLEPVDGPDLRT